ncbi:Glycoside hydrolase [Coemansia sp. RSA 1200]|nr:Glycoside hydrolase [Coemansia sp. RSA 1200]
MVGIKFATACILYEVKPGDYCYKIAIYNGITYEQFLKQNPGINCTNLQVGQSVCLVPLKMPSWSSGWDNNGYDTEDDSDDIYQEAKASHLNCSNSYTVKEGDMCVSIAAHNDIPVGKLR